MYYTMFNFSYFYIVCVYKCDKEVTVELRTHVIAHINATSLFLVFCSSMPFPDLGGGMPSVPSCMLFPDSELEFDEKSLGRNHAWAQFQWYLLIKLHAQRRAEWRKGDCAHKCNLSLFAVLLQYAVSRFRGGNAPLWQAVCCFPTYSLKLTRTLSGGIMRGRNFNGTC